MALLKKLSSRFYCLCSKAMSTKLSPISLQHGGVKRLLKFTVGASIAGISGWTYYHSLTHRIANFNVLADAGLVKPDFPPTRQIRRETDSTGLKLTLFQYQTCPFCCKVRAFLDYNGFSYDVVEVNSVWRTQTKWSKYKKVPILICEDTKRGTVSQLNDSSVIMSLLESYLEDRTTPVEKLVTYFPSIESKVKGKTVYDFPNRYFVMYLDKDIKTSTAEQRKEERKYRKWTDEWLVHTLSPNVYRTPREALQAFNYFSEVGEWEKVFSSFERYVVIYIGATAMYFIGKLLKRRHELPDDVRQSLYDACDDWVKAIGKKRTFMGGDKPNLADLSVYGVLSSIEGCEAFQDALVNSKIKKWYFATKKSVHSSSGIHPLNAKYM